MPLVETIPGVDSKYLRALWFAWRLPELDNHQATLKKTDHPIILETYATIQGGPESLARAARGHGAVSLLLDQVHAYPPPAKYIELIKKRTSLPADFWKDKGPIMVAQEADPFGEFNEPALHECKTWFETVGDKSGPDQTKLVRTGHLWRKGKEKNGRPVFYCQGCYEKRVRRIVNQVVSEAHKYPRWSCPIVISKAKEPDIKKAVASWKAKAKEAKEAIEAMELEIKQTIAEAIAEAKGEDYLEAIELEIKQVIASWKAEAKGEDYSEAKKAEINQTIASWKIAIWKAEDAHYIYKLLPQLSGPAILIHNQPDDLPGKPIPITRQELFKALYPYCQTPEGRRLDGSQGFGRDYAGDKGDGRKGGGPTSKDNEDNEDQIKQLIRIRGKGYDFQLATCRQFGFLNEKESKRGNARFNQGLTWPEYIEALDLASIKWKCVEGEELLQKILDEDGYIATYVQGTAKDKSLVRKSLNEVEDSPEQPPPKPFYMDFSREDRQ